MNAEVGNMVVLAASINCGSQCDCADPGTGADDCKCEDHQRVFTALVRRGCNGLKLVMFSEDENEYRKLF